MMMTMITMMTMMMMMMTVMMVVMMTIMTLMTSMMRTMVMGVVMAAAVTVNVRLIVSDKQFFSDAGEGKSVRAKL